MPFSRSRCTADDGTLLLQDGIFVAFRNPIYEEQSALVQSLSFDGRRRGKVPSSVVQRERQKSYLRGAWCHSAALVGLPTMALSPSKIEFSSFSGHQGSYLGGVKCYSAARVEQPTMALCPSGSDFCRFPETKMPFRRSHWTADDGILPLQDRISVAFRRPKILSWRSTAPLTVSLIETVFGVPKIQKVHLLCERNSF